MELDPKKSYLITVDGSVTEIAPLNGKEFELEEMQKHVEGYVELVQLTEKQIMLVNEEGKFDKKYNCVASGIADLFHALFAGDYICGNAVVCPSEMFP